LNKNKNILLIGGAGYIGLVTANYLISKGYKVSCLDSLIYSQKDCLDSFDSIKDFFIYGDVRSYDIKKILKNFDSVVILAGLVGDPITKKYPEQSEEINYFGIKKIIDACKNQKLKNLIFVSTCYNYGFIDNNITADENYKLNPISSYAKHKVEIEKYIMSLKNQVDYSPTILRFATAFGLSQRMRFDLTINQFTKDIAEDKTLEVYDADTWRPYCHVIDFARLIKTVLQADKEKIHFEVYNAGSNENNFTKRQIVEEIIKIIPNKKITFVKGGVDARNYRVNFLKLNKKLNFTTKFSVPYGIKEIYNAIKFKKLGNELNKLGNFEINK